MYNRFYYFYKGYDKFNFSVLYESDSIGILNERVSSVVKPFSAFIGQYWDFIFNIFINKKKKYYYNI